MLRNDSSMILDPVKFISIKHHRVCSDWFSQQNVRSVLSPQPSNPLRVIDVGVGEQVLTQPNKMVGQVCWDSRIEWNDGMMWSEE